jgi:hypothetical protein
MLVYCRLRLVEHTDCSNRYKYLTDGIELSLGCDERGLEFTGAARGICSGRCLSKDGVSNFRVIILH